MSYNPESHSFEMPFETLADVEALFAEAIEVSKHPSKSRREWASRDLEDKFFWLGANRPEYARHFHARFIKLSDEEFKVFAFRFEIWLYLLHGAEDSIVEELTAIISRHPEDLGRLEMLAAICTPLALKNLAALAREPKQIDYLEGLGFELPPDGLPARPRFTTWRRALRKVTLSRVDQPTGRLSNPINLPLAEIVENPDSTEISWHYLSLNLAGIEGLPMLPVEQLHLVSPPIFPVWTLYCDILKDGKYKVRSIEQLDEPDEESDAEMAEWLQDQADSPESADRGYVELVPFDDDLCYANGHIYWTEEIVGEVGGPPSLMYAYLKCPCCNRPMFYVFTVKSDIRAYGDGWRNLLICEDCLVVACTGTGWN